MSDGENMTNSEAPAEKPAAVAASNEAPPQRIELEKYEAAIAEKRALESRLAEIEKAKEAAAAKEAEEQGRWQDLAKQHESKATEAARKAERLERMLQLTDHGVGDPDLRDFALYRYEQSGSDKDFGAFVKAEMKEGGALAKLMPAPANEELAEKPKPSGTRTGGTSHPDIPAECIAEAQKHGMDPEYWHNRVWKPRQARKTNSA